MWVKTGSKRIDMNQEAIQLPYGSGSLDLSLKGLAVAPRIIRPRELTALRDPVRAVRNALDTPIGCPPLAWCLRHRKPGTPVAILLTDHTRAVPYSMILPQLIAALEEAGVQSRNIHFIVAGGTHPPMSPKQSRDFYGNLPYPVYVHDARAEDLVTVGRLKNGNPVRINTLAAQAGFLLATGVINTHYLAGFSGGRKSILPGITDYETTRVNHTRVLDPAVGLGRLQGNPIHEEMMQAAAMARLRFILNVVLNADKKIAAVFAGEPEKAFLQGTRFVRESYGVHIEEPAHCVLVTPGGAPKDRTLYHTQKCINNVLPLVKKDGLIIVLSQCGEGPGNQEMVRFLRNASRVDELLALPPGSITIGGHRAMATARILNHAEVVLVSDLPAEDVRAMHFTPADSAEEALHIAGDRFGKYFRMHIVPDGDHVFFTS